MSRTVFLDIDGTIFGWSGGDYEDFWYKEKDNGYLLPGVKEKFAEWALKDYHIVITTAREEKYRKITIEQLNYYGLWYNDLLMGLPNYVRVLINDRKPSCESAFAYCIPRDKGLKDLDV